VANRHESSPGFKADHWEQLDQGYRSHLERFVREMDSSWKNVFGGVKALEETVNSWSPPVLHASKLESIRTLYGGTGRELLGNPIAARLRSKPQLQALTAIGDLGNSLENVVLALPRTVLASGEILARVLGRRAGNAFRQRWMRRQTGLKPLALRQIVATQFQEETLRRAELDGEFQLLLARTSLHLLTPWQVARRRALRYLEDPSEEPGEIGRHRAAWIGRSGKLEKQAGRLLARYEKWRDAAPSRLARQLASGRTMLGADRLERMAVQHQEYLSYWFRQQNAVQNILELETKLRRLAEEVVTLAGETLDSVEAEHASLIEELQQAIEHLERIEASGEPGEAPPPRTRMLAARARIERLTREATLRSSDELPEETEAVRPRYALPPWREPWRKIRPRDAFRNGLRDLEAPGAGGRLLEAESAHRAILREIERAREVVAYSSEASRDGDGEEDWEVGREGLQNALGLLRSQLEATPGVRTPTEEGLVRGVAAALAETHFTLEQGRLGVLAHVAQETSERGIRRVLAVAAAGVRRGVARFEKLASEFFRRVLYALGLKTPPADTREAVTRTVRLGEAFPLKAVREDLPHIYRRLFRLEPVVDPRFLVGRDDELTGLREARAQWLNGRAVSILVVGARGSGKTSLLNCAGESVFKGLDVVAGQFGDRLTTAEEMRRFLEQLLQVPAGADLRAELNDRKRVIILEEGERTFLRTLNGFGALRYLLELITKTWHSTLWILSLNEAAAQYLDRSAGLGDWFFHRINAMSVEPEELRAAILLRHNLSGYRLSFPAESKDGVSVNRMRRQLGIETDAEGAFFNSIYEQSVGIFRSAFELWQSQIARIEGGIVHMDAPAKPDYGALLKTLSVNDCFTLQAILQHGSLTNGNLASVFDEDLAAGSSRLERLIALEVLEQDPSNPGYRVRPEAGRLVREALHSHNL